MTDIKWIPADDHPHLLRFRPLLNREIRIACYTDTTLNYTEISLSQWILLKALPIYIHSNALHFLENYILSFASTISGEEYYPLNSFTNYEREKDHVFVDIHYGKFHTVEIAKVWAEKLAQLIGYKE